MTPTDRMVAPHPLRWLLDTNIISELVRESVNPGVEHAFREYSGQCALAAAVWHELQFGLQRLPPGRRRRTLERLVGQVVNHMPVLPYDLHSAALHAQLRAQADAQGRRLSEPDAHIASIALQHQLTLVTRNLQDFEAIPGLQLTNWFEAT